MASLTSPKRKALESILSGAALVITVACLQATPLGTPNPSALLALSGLLFVPSLLCLRSAPRPFRIALLIAFGALAANLLTLHPSSLDDLSGIMRGSEFRVSLLGLSLLFLARGTIRRLVYMLVGVCLGMIAFGIVDHPTAGTFASLWKYYIAYPTVVLFLFLLVKWLRRPALIAVGGALLAGITLALDFRSQAGLLLLAVALWLARGRKSHPTMSSIGKRVSIFAVTLVALVTFLPKLALNGTLGSALQQQFYSNALVGSNPIFSGRPEIAIALGTALERPLAGWGTIPPMSDQLLARAEALAPSFGLHVNETTIQIWAPDGTVNPHSITMETWIRCGILGLLFCLILLGLAVRFLFTSEGVPQSARLPLTYLTVQLIWELVFSPITYGVDSLLALGLLFWTTRGRGHEETDAPPPYSPVRQQPIGYIRD